MGIITIPSQCFHDDAMIKLYTNEKDLALVNNVGFLPASLNQSHHGLVNMMAYTTDGK